MESMFYLPEETVYQDEAKRFFEREAPPYVQAMDRKNEYAFEMLKKMGRGATSGCVSRRSTGAAAAT